MFVQWNAEERSCKYFCCAKAINITYCQGVFVALGIQHAMHMRHAINCGPPRSTIFLHLMSQKARLKKSY